MVDQVKDKIGELEAKLKLISAQDIMSTEVITTNLTTTLAELSDQMIKARVSGMPVLDKNNKVMGIVTQTDLLIVMSMVLEGTARGAGNISTINPTVDFAMSNEVVSVEGDTTLDDIVKLMRDKSIHTLPVMKGDQLIGIIGKHDAMKRFYEAVKDL